MPGPDEATGKGWEGRLHLGHLIDACNRRIHHVERLEAAASKRERETQDAVQKLHESKVLVEQREQIVRRREESHDIELDRFRAEKKRSSEEFAEREKGLAECQQALNDREADVMGKLDLLSKQEIAISQRLSELEQAIHFLEKKKAEWEASRAAHERHDTDASGAAKSFQTSDQNGQAAASAPKAEPAVASQPVASLADPVSGPNIHSQPRTADLGTSAAPGNINAMPSEQAAAEADPLTQVPASNLRSAEELQAQSSTEADSADDAHTRGNGNARSKSTDHASQDKVTGSNSQAGIPDLPDGGTAGLGDDDGHPPKAVAEPGSAEKDARFQGPAEQPLQPEQDASEPVEGKTNSQAGTAAAESLVKEHSPPGPLEERPSKRARASKGQSTVQDDENLNEADDSGGDGLSAAPRAPGLAAAKSNTDSEAKEGGHGAPEETTSNGGGNIPAPDSSGGEQLREFDEPLSAPAEKTSAPLEDSRQAPASTGAQAEPPPDQISHPRAQQPPTGTSAKEAVPATRNTPDSGGRGQSWRQRTEKPQAMDLHRSEHGLRTRAGLRRPHDSYHHYLRGPPLNECQGPPPAYGKPSAIHRHVQPGIRPPIPPPAPPKVPPPALPRGRPASPVKRPPSKTGRGGRGSGRQARGRGRATAASRKAEGARKDDIGAAVEALKAVYASEIEDSGSEQPNSPMSGQ